jgi:hypothetical protein
MTHVTRLANLSGQEPQRLSRSALLFTGLLHLGLLGLLLQTAPVAQLGQQVVQYLKPITPMQEPNPVKPPVKPKIAPVKSLARPTPAVTVPAQPVPQRAITEPVPPAVLEKPVVRPPKPQVQPEPTAPAVPPPAPSPGQETEAEPLPPVPEVKVTEVPLPETVPRVVAPIPPPAQARQEAPVPAPPEPANLVPVAATLPSIAEVAPSVPAPPQPQAQAQVQPVMTPTTVSEPVPVLVQSQVLKAAPAATNAEVRPAAITPVAAALPQSAASATSSTTAATSVTGPARTPATGPNLAASGPAMRGQTRSFPNVMLARPGQRSLAEMANEQINGGRTPRDKLADGIGDAALPDCVAPNPGGSLIGLVTLPYAAATGKCRMPR